MARLIILCCILLSGCSIFDRPIKTEIQQVKIPVMVCPKPDMPDRPELLIHNIPMDDLESPGKIVKYYEATIQQLLFYSYELETLMKVYQNLNTNDVINDSELKSDK
jgi:hypothetical protein